MKHKGVVIINYGYQSGSDLPGVPNPAVTLYRASWYLYS